MKRSTAALLMILSLGAVACGKTEAAKTAAPPPNVIVAPVITLFDQESFTTAREVLAKAHETCLVANSVKCDVIVEPLFRLE